ncbi:hypothetical protein DFH27DRAFT_478701 [Peziza echinospora]|nr:hypothetical protein DFH27DRAFT_478701 [Peziza echinospora]
MFLITLCTVAFIFLNPGSAGLVQLPIDIPSKEVQSQKPGEVLNPGPFSDKKHLVVVAGHAIWKGGPMLGEVDEEWTLEPYQKGHNESLTWIEHIEKGVEIMSADPESLLVFSGGETRASSGPRTESQSYWNLADTRNLLTPDTYPLATTEIFARDSFENLLFSICRFREYTGIYPKSVTVIGYEFKRHRFSQVHRPAILFPEDRFTYVGIDHKNQTLVDEMAKFEKSHSLVPFEKDPYACFEEVLVEKKKSRGWAGRGTGGYERSCPELQALLRYCGLQKDGTVKLYDGPLPWTH